MFKDIFRLIYLLNPLWILNDLIRLSKRPKNQFDLWRDFFCEFNKNKFIRRNIRTMSSSDSKALVVSLSDNPFQIKIEVIMAIALRRQNWKVKVLLRNKSHRWAIRYFSIYGFEDYCYFNKFPISESLKGEVDDRYNHYFSVLKDNAELKFNSVKNWTFRNCRVGTQILSSVGRGIRTSHLDVNSPEIRRGLIKWLRVSLETVVKAEMLIDFVTPKLMYLMEANYAYYGSISDVAVNREIDLIQLCQIGQDDALIARRLNSSNRRCHPWSITKENLFKFSKLPLTIVEDNELKNILSKRYDGSSFLQSRNHPRNSLHGKDEIFNFLNLDKKKKVAVLYSHVLWDANLFYGEDLFEDYGQWFIETIRALTSSPDVNWIVKLHPANAWKRKRLRAKDKLSEISLIEEKICPINQLPPNIKFLQPDSPIGTVALREFIDYAVTVRGSVAVELPLFGIPVLTAGTGRASGFGFTIDSRNSSEYLSKIKNIQEVSPLSDKQIELAKCYAYSVLKCRPWIMKSFKSNYMPITHGSHPLDHNISTNVKSWDELSANGDIDKLGEWAINVNQIDFFDTTRSDFS